MPHFVWVLTLGRSTAQIRNKSWLDSLGDSVLENVSFIKPLRYTKLA